MSAFEFVFTFYIVMLGLAAANFGTSVADMWRDRRATEVGVCPPLLALMLARGRPANRLGLTALLAWMLRGLFR